MTTEYSDDLFVMGEHIVRCDGAGQIDDAIELTAASWLRPHEMRIALGVLRAIRMQVEKGGAAEVVVTTKSFCEFMGERHYQNSWTALLRTLFEVHRDRGADLPVKRNLFERKRPPNRETMRVFAFNRYRLCRALGVSMLRDRNHVAWGA